MATWIEQWGIRWTFDRDISLDGAGDTYRYGQFVNGDYWIIGPVNIVGIDPPSHATVEGEKDENGNDFVVGTIINGSMINPPIEGHTHAYSSGATVGWTPELNVAWGVDAENPLAIQAHSSLISTVGKRDTGTGNRSSVQRASILTVLPSDAFDNLPEGVEPSDCFRPAYIGSTKIIRHWKQQLRYDFPGQLAPVEETWPGLPSLAAMEAQFQKPWIRKGLGWTSRYIHPADSMPDYYMQMATNNGALVLNLNYTNEQKETLLVNYSQLGIDLYGPYEAGSRGNGPDGGLFAGLLLPILVAGNALDYAPMRNICAKSGSYRYSAKPGGGNYGDGDLPPDYLYFQELDQTFYVTANDVARTNSPQWNPDTRTQPNLPYTEAMIGLPEWGIRQSTDPYQSDAGFPQANYRALNSSPYAQTGFLMLVMGMKAAVNHDAFFDYGDRWAATQGQSAMRAAYRDDYGAVWTADLSVFAEWTGKSDTTIDLKATISGGVGDYTVQWQRWDGEAFIDIVGATTAEYTVTGLSAEQEYTFRIVVEDEESPPTEVTDIIVVSTTGTEEPVLYLLTKSPNIMVSGATPVTGDYYEADAVLTLTAVEGRYSIFIGWSGDASGTRKQIQITMNSAKNITANFAAAERKSKIVTAGNFILPLTTKHEVAL